MHPTRIAELLEPFLTGAPAVCHSEPAKAVYSAPCHSEHAQSAGEEPASLSPAQLQDISTYIDLLLRWNARLNLTAIRTPEEIVTRHFGESLFAARCLFPQSSQPAATQWRQSLAANDDALVPKAFANDQRPTTNDPPNIARPTLADVGSGAGFPGLPIKLWASQISLTLIESNHKKATFLREVTHALTLTNVNIQTARAESLTTTFSVVTLRAVERFETILPAAAALVAPGGRLALLISSAQLDSARSSLPHFTWLAPTAVPLAHSRILQIAQRPR